MDEQHWNMRFLSYCIYISKSVIVLPPPIRRSIVAPPPPSPSLQLVAGAGLPGCCYRPPPPPPTHLEQQQQQITIVHLVQQGVRRKEKSAKQFGEQKVNMSFFFPLLQSVHLLNYFDMLWRVGELVTYFLGTRLRDLF